MKNSLKTTHLPVLFGKSCRLRKKETACPIRVSGLGLQGWNLELSWRVYKNSTCLEKGSEEAKVCMLGKCSPPRDTQKDASEFQKDGWMWIGLWGVDHLDFGYPFEDPAPLPPLSPQLSRVSYPLFPSPICCLLEYNRDQWLCTRQSSCRACGGMSHLSVLSRSGIGSWISHFLAPDFDTDVGLTLVLFTYTKRSEFGGISGILRILMIEEIAGLSKALKTLFKVNTQSNTISIFFFVV